MRAVAIRRVYDSAGSDRGAAVLIDRLWPRGIAKAAATWREWLREAAPSTELRRWYGHQPELFPEFERRYRDELAHSAAGADALGRLRELLAAEGAVTLVTSVREIELSHAEVLRRILEGREPDQPEAEHEER